MLGLGINVWLANSGQPWMPSGAAWGVNLAGPGATFARASAGTYEASGRISTFAAGAPRTGARGMLIEPARTNLISYSAPVAPHWWALGVTLNALTENALGVFPGVRVASGGADWHRYTLPEATFVAGDAYAMSVWYRAGSSGSVRLTMQVGSPFVLLGLTGAPGALSAQSQTGGSLTGVVNEALGGGVFKCTFSFSVAAGTTGRWGIGPNSTTVGRDVIVYGAQIERAATPSSYIATNGGAALRAADALTVMAPPGRYTVTVTFDDGSTQTLTGQTVTAAGWGVPTNLNRPYIKTITAEVA